MYIHKQKLQHVSSPEKPDAVYARKLQEVIGGQYGEITVAMQYSFCLLYTSPSPRDS